MSDHALLRWHRTERDRNERRAGAERRSGKERRDDRRQGSSHTVEQPCAVEPLRTVSPAALEFVTPWQLAEPAP